ncbi:hypothetical protein [Prosthecobacter sp.]|uniref:hypothetical protein n=1 Tax=Prosthecobacter sp. TaxID=1965333 RepID=UPI002ABC1EBC|nr:hypothetical protein [Prosthecobacter sp.]MDZ4403298.1 hypothetical protein [Prosthecobacter sp.]
MLIIFSLGGDQNETSKMMTSYRSCCLISMLLCLMQAGQGSAAPSADVQDGKNAGVSKSAGWYFMGDKAKPLTSLDALPAGVLGKLQAHLKSRLGREFYADLKFSSGRQADAEEMRGRATSKNASDFRMYDIQFTWSLPDSGVESYVAQIGLREDGSVFEEIDLPAFTSKKGALPLVPLKKAKEVAKLHGFAKTSFETAIGYDRETDALFWRFSRPAGDEFFPFDPAPRTGGLHFYHLEVSAHDGSIVRQYLSRVVN